MAKKATAGLLIGGLAIAGIAILAGKKKEKPTPSLLERYQYAMFHYQEMSASELAELEKELSDAGIDYPPWKR